MNTQPNSTFQATLYASNNTIKPIFPSNGRNFSVSELRYHIGGDYQYWALPEGATIVVSSDNILETTPRNEPLFHVLGIPYVGNVIIGTASMFASKNADHDNKQ